MCRSVALPAGVSDEHVLLVVQLDRAQIPIDPLHQVAVALLGGLFQAGEKLLLRGGHLGAGEPDAHVVGDPRLARRVDHPRGELGNVDPRLHPRAALEPEQPARLAELIEGVEHVEICGARDRQTRLAGQPGEFRRRIAVGVVGEERMAMNIHEPPDLGQHDLPGLHLLQNRPEHLPPLGGIEAVQLLLKSFDQSLRLLPSANPSSHISIADKRQHVARASCP
jgi:hypothetical protein